MYLYLEGLDRPSYTNKDVLTEYAGINSSVFIGITIFKSILVLFLKLMYIPKLIIV